MFIILKYLAKWLDSLHRPATVHHLQAIKELSKSQLNVDTTVDDMQNMEDTGEQSDKEGDEEGQGQGSGEDGEDGEEVDENEGEGEGEGGEESVDLLDFGAIDDGQAMGQATEGGAGGAGGPGAWAGGDPTDMNEQEWAAMQYQQQQEQLRVQEQQLYDLQMQQQQMQMMGQQYPQQQQQQQQYPQQQYQQQQYPQQFPQQQQQYPQQQQQQLQQPPLGMGLLAGQAQGPTAVGMAVGMAVPSSDPFANDLLLLAPPPMFQEEAPPLMTAGAAAETGTDPAYDDAGFLPPPSPSAAANQGSPSKTSPESKGAASPSASGGKSSGGGGGGGGGSSWRESLLLASPFDQSAEGVVNAVVIGSGVAITANSDLLCLHVASLLATLSDHQDQDKARAAAAPFVLEVLARWFHQSSVRILTTLGPISVKLWTIPANTNTGLITQQLRFLLQALLRHDADLRSGLAFKGAKGKGGSGSGGGGGGGGGGGDGGTRGSGDAADASVAEEAMDRTAQIEASCESVVRALQSFVSFLYHNVDLIHGQW